jgi:ketosteroid isomerase-like protein
MSQENVENLRGYLESWNGRTLQGQSRPWEGILSSEVVADLFDPDVVYEDGNPPDHVGESYRGLDGVIRAAERWVEPCEWLIVELERILDAGDRVVSIHRAQMQMRYNGIEFGSPMAYVYTFRDGKIVHFRSYVDPSEALEAVGLGVGDARNEPRS